MDDERCLDACRDLAKRLGIGIRYIGSGNSGLCTVRGKRVFFLNRTHGPHAQARAFVRDLRTLDLDGYFIVPALRDLLEDDDDSDWNAD